MQNMSIPEIIYEDLRGYAVYIFVGGKVIIDSGLPQEEKERLLGGWLKLAQIAPGGAQ